ncbi:MAG: glycoside hydrolase family 130 protein [Actinomycetota bacterium]|nr:glycoside hydrolase family 130 protein [Actinomycetota bacterium]
MTERLKNINVFRSERNPIINPDDVIPSRHDFKVVGVFNCGVTRFDGEILLLMRVAEKPFNNDKKIEIVPLLDPEAGKISVKKFNKDDSSFVISDPRFIRTTSGWYLTTISHLRIARSKNGIDFIVDEEPAMSPENKYERFGMEDPRITQINGIYYISYCAVSDLNGITTCLASTTDFIEFTRYGVIFLPDNKDVAIFPEKINGKYYALSRPISTGCEARDMWISESPDFICWGNHMKLMGTRKQYWDEGSIGAGAIPFRIKEGWLEIYHGSSKINRYCLGAVLLDAGEPWKVVARTKEPIIEPEMDYEKNGFFGNVIFTCGSLYEEDKVKIYYGAADTCIAYAEIDLDDILYRLD